MSLFQSNHSSFNLEEDRRALVTVKDKENQVDYKSFQSGRIKELSLHIEQTSVKYNYEKEELSFRAKGLQTQVIDLKNQQLRLREQLRMERSIKEAVEKQLSQFKEYKSRYEKTDNEGADILKRMKLELSQRNREVEMTKQELTSERLRGRIDSQKDRRRIEELDDIKRQISSHQKQYQQSKMAQKQLQQKLGEAQRATVELKFEKSTLLQQLKFYKSEKQSLQNSNNQQKCEELISVTRQLNQMSLECAKWRTQWEQLRSQQESIKQQGLFHLGVKQQLQRTIKSLKQIIQQKKQSSDVYEAEMSKAQVQVAKIQEGERIRKEQMIKKDRYVLKLEAESKKFEVECQNKIKEVELFYSSQVSALQKDKQQLQNQLDEITTQQLMNLLQSNQLKNDKAALLQQVQEQKYQRSKLQEHNVSLGQQIFQLKIKIKEVEEVVCNFKKIIEELSSEIELKNQHMEETRKARRDLEHKHSIEVEMINKQIAQTAESQIAFLSEQLKSKQIQLCSLREENETLSRNISEYEQGYKYLKMTRQQENKRFRVEREGLKKALNETQIRLRVAESESAGMEHIMNEEMSKRNHVIEQLVREVRERRD